MIKEFIYGFYARLLFQLVVYNSSINPIFKIIYIFAADRIDSEIYRYKIKKTYFDFSSCSDYHLIDKINDFIGYLLVHSIVCKNKLLNESNYMILSYVLLYRIIGYISVYITKKRYLFLLFFDMYKEVLIVFYFIKNTKLKYSLIFLLFLLKLNIEYKFHYKTIYKV